MISAIYDRVEMDNPSKLGLKIALVVFLGTTGSIFGSLIIMRELAIMRESASVINYLLAQAAFFVFLGSIVLNVTSLFWTVKMLIVVGGGVSLGKSWAGTFLSVAAVILWLPFVYLLIAFTVGVGPAAI